VFVCDDWTGCDEVQLVEVGVENEKLEIDPVVVVSDPMGSSLVVHLGPLGTESLDGHRVLSGIHMG
jgi:hypothetical protein